MKRLTDYAWTEHEIERELSIVSWHTTKIPFPAGRRAFKHATRNPLLHC